MNCEEIGGMLTDFLRGSLAPDRRSAVEEHLAQCAECRDDAAIWEKLTLLPTEMPSTASATRFESLMEAYQAGRTDGRTEKSAGPAPAARWWAFDWFRTPLGGLAWGAAVLALGIFAGTFTSRVSTHTEELSAMRTELTSMRQMVVLSMLQQQSASERLQGVSFSQREAHADPQVIAALLHTLRYDQSVDVRLAALDALGRNANQIQVHSGVADALRYQQSPLVQVALIDQLVEWRDPGLNERLREFQRSGNLNPAVEQRTEWALAKLN